ncbi:MAG: MFS transporter, partial [Parvularculaceae bacterium]|nr:MFS transporter [Parvularculaceae bacterium]
MPSDAATTAPSGARRTALAIVSVSAGSVLYTLDANIAAVALPAIARDLGASSVGVVALVSVYNLVLAMALLPLAAVGQQIGLRRVFVAGLVAYLFAAAICLLAAHSLPLLIAARAFQAAAAGAVLSVSIALVRSLYAPSTLGRGLGFNTVASASGAALAPALGGWRIGAASWPVVFATGV